MMPAHGAAAASIGCGAAAIATPGGPTAVPFRPCCALAIIESAASCPIFSDCSESPDQSGRRGPWVQSSRSGPHDDTAGPGTPATAHLIVESS